MKSREPFEDTYIFDAAISLLIIVILILVGFFVMVLQQKATIYLKQIETPIETIETPAQQIDTKSDC